MHNASRRRGSIARAEVVLVLLVTVAAVISCRGSEEGPLLVAGARLVPAEPRLHDACARAANTTGFAIGCPTFIVEHRGTTGESCPTSDSGPGGFRDCVERPAAGGRPDVFLYTQNDLVLPGALHLFVVSIRTSAALLPYRVGCGDAGETRTPGPDLAGTSTEWVECPDGSSMHAGHVLLRWQRGEVSYAVSLHGHTVTNRLVEQELASRIAYVDP
jgi:hypothetical protein